MKACFFDTSAVLDTLRNRVSVQQVAEPYDRPLVSAVAWGELMAGLRKARDPQAELARLEALLSAGQIISADQTTAVIYGELLAELESRGQRIPTNDIWIAATAVQFDLPLLARDEHFGRVTSLRWISY